MIKYLALYAASWLSIRQTDAVLYSPLWWFGITLGLTTCFLVAAELDLRYNKKRRENSCYPTEIQPSQPDS